MRTGKHWPASCRNWINWLRRLPMFRSPELRRLVLLAAVVVGLTMHFRGGGGLPDIFPSDCGSLKDGDEHGDLDYQACELCSGESASERERASVCYVTAAESLHLPDAGSVTVDQVTSALSKCVDGFKPAGEIDKLLKGQGVQNRYDIADFYAEVAEGVSHGAN